MSRLPSSWEFDFLEAPFECEGASELRNIYTGPYSCFFQQYSKASMQQAVEYVREVVDEDGPYDCIMGFSQVCGPRDRIPPVRVAVLKATNRPTD